MARFSSTFFLALLLCFINNAVCHADPDKNSEPGASNLRSEEEEPLPDFSCHDLLGTRRIAVKHPPYIAQHEVFVPSPDRYVPVVPGAAFVEMVASLAKLDPRPRDTTTSVLKIGRLIIARALCFDGRTRVPFTIVQSEGKINAVSFEIKSLRNSHVHGTMTRAEQFPNVQFDSVGAPRVVARAAIYPEGVKGLIAYGPSFQVIDEIRIFDSVSREEFVVEADLTLPEGLSIDGYVFHPGALDGMFQAANLGLGRTAVPGKLSEVWIDLRAVPSRRYKVRINIGQVGTNQYSFDGLIEANGKPVLYGKTTMANFDLSRSIVNH